MRHFSFARSCSPMQDKAELHSKFSSQYLAELEALRAQHTRLGAQSSNGNGSQEGEAVVVPSIFFLSTSKMTWHFAWYL